MKSVSHADLDALARRLFRDPAHAKMTIVFLALLLEVIGVIVMFSARLLK